MPHKNKDIRNAYQREKYKDPKIKLAVRNRSLKYDFGITLVDYNTMLLAQDGKCKTCNRSQSEIKRTFAVDHDHKTNKVRGLLCDFCNRTLGVYEKKKELFASFDAYLEGIDVIHS